AGWLLGCRLDPLDAAEASHHVDFALRVLTERGDLPLPCDQLFAEVSLGRDTAVDVLESEERAAVVVGIKVGSPKCWNRGPAIHVASRDTDSDAATVLGNGLGHALDGTRVGPVAVRSLTHVPPEIVVTLPARDDVDLFPAV